MDIMDLCTPYPDSDIVHLFCRLGLAHYSSGFGLELACCAARVIAASRRHPRKLAHLEEGITPVRLDHNGPLAQIKATIQDLLALHGRPSQSLPGRAAAPA
ncbi:hypothetical protein VTN77DRAFT_9654 [Rasamsonia byssochlamydoides]|uniref:uncharacterized protein n=1 Tax=Rasamsonia byssochlamydoides TaxID=89139 RepID=UPI003741F415